MRHLVGLVVTLTLLAACAARQADTPPEPLGDFRLGYNVVVAKNAEPVGPSRQATAEEWETALKAAVAAQLGRYQGDKLYHVGIGVDGYALALPGIPLLLSPKSALVITVNVWDDTAGRKINAEPKQLTVLEPVSGRTLVGSGLTKTREEQIASLSEAAARRINDWLVENRIWFSPEAVAARAALSAAVKAQKAGAAPALPEAAIGGN
ncbi:hypothetical protein [Albidovulum sp.]